MPSKTAKPSWSEPRDKKATRRIAIVAFPGVTLLDISGPAQVFAELEAIELPGPDYSLAVEPQQVVLGEAESADRYL